MAEPSPKRPRINSPALDKEEEYIQRGVQKFTQKIRDLKAEVEKERSARLISDGEIERLDNAFNKANPRTESYPKKTRHLNRERKRRRRRWNDSSEKMYLTGNSKTRSVFWKQTCREPTASSSTSAMQKENFIKEMRVRPWHDLIPRKAWIGVLTTVVRSRKVDMPTSHVAEDRTGKLKR